MRLAVAFTLAASPLIASSIGFDGQQVTLALYYPTFSPSNLIGFGVTTVTSGATTFSNINTFPQPGVALAIPNITLNGSIITYQIPPSEVGFHNTATPFNGEVFTLFTPANTPEDITGVSLIGSNYLTQASLGFSANSIYVNEAGTTYPANGFAAIAVTFGTPPPPGTGPQLVAPQKSPADVQFYKDMALASGLVAGAFAVAAASTPCTALCGVEAGLFTGESAYFSSKDPVDFNYTVIPAATPIAPVNLPGASFLTPQTTFLFNDIQTDIDDLEGLVNAAYTAENRANGAFISGNATYELMQLNALDSFISQERADATALGDDLVQLSGLLPQGTGIDPTQLLAGGDDFLDAANPTPEPSTWAGVLAGIGGLLLLGRHATCKLP